MQKREILNKQQIEISLHRLALQIHEEHGDFKNTAIIGLQPRGIVLAKKIHQILGEVSGNKHIPFGELDSTFYRDDFRRTTKPLIPNTIELSFSVENKRIVLIDDVLYTGRSVRSALNALTDFGRPINTELLVLIDRKYNRELPIQPDYTGEAVDTRAKDRVLVELHTDEPKVWIITEENNP
jgi:pyrimidine operon attenuation protein/uracil phosphoribosyltransferase